MYVSPQSRTSKLGILSRKDEPPIRVYVALPCSLYQYIIKHQLPFNTPQKFIVGRITGLLPFTPPPMPYNPNEPVLRNSILFKRPCYLQIMNILEAHGFKGSGKKQNSLKKGFIWFVYCFDKERYDRRLPLRMLSKVGGGKIEF